MVHEAHVDHLRGQVEIALATIRHQRYGKSSPVEEAVSYILEGQGKRVRPILAMLAAETVGGRAETALPAALAVEMVHCYSLVHDDLPCMDDDDVRRGRPTAHKVHGEAQALLAGDALLTDAFHVLANGDLPAPVVVAMIRELALAAGSAGMVRGQSLDLKWTGHAGKEPAGLETLEAIHLGKTGALLGATCAMGALAGGGGAADALRLREFGRSMGLAFQVIDDLLDDGEGTGKSAGKDRKAGKLTYLTHMSREEARAEAFGLTEKATMDLAPYGAQGAPLIDFTRDLLARNR